MIPFISPVWFLWLGAGAVTAGVPVIIHLIHRRQAPRILFSTLRFLKISVERTARRRRIQDLLLLILRACLFFLLAFALAKPFFRGGSPFGGAADTSVALIVDNSASMGMVQRDETRFARAKEIARTFLAEHLRSGRDSCCLIFTNGPESTAAPALENALQKVDARLNESNLSAGFADLAAAVERAADCLAKSKDPNRELYVITDMQASSWKGLSLDSPLRSRPDLPFVLINCGTTDYEDLAAADLAIDGEGQVVEMPVTIRATISNPSNRALSRFVSLYIDRAKAANTAEPVQVPPGGTNQVAFTHTFHAAGQYAGWVRVDNDSLDLDNQRNFTIAIADRLPVLLVRDEESPVAYQDEAYFLAAALNPFSVLDVTHKWALDPKAEVTDRLTPEVLRQFPVVFLLNSRKVTPALAQDLADYVRQGGGLVLGVGDAVAPDAWNQAFGAVQAGEKPLEGGLLPARLVSKAGDAAEREAGPHPDQADLHHFIFKPFAKFPSLYQKIAVKSYLRVERPLPRAALPLLTLEGGDPLILERPIGDGRVVLVTTSLNDAWTGMPASNFYMPFVQRLVFYLARRTAGHTASYTAGAAVRVPFPGVAEPATLHVTLPNDETVEVKTQAGQVGQEALLPDRLTFEPGVYSYQSPQHDQVRGAFAINFDPAEADLAPLDWKDLAARLPLRRAWCVTDLAQLKSRIVAMREGVQLWNLFLFAVLMLAVFETFVANRIRPGAEAPQKGVGHRA